MWPFNESPILAEKASFQDAQDMAAIHAKAFQHAWSTEEILRLIEAENVVAFKCKRPSGILNISSSKTSGFVLARKAADEAEILTLAVLLEARRHGLGRLLMQAVINDLYNERIYKLFLEVDAENQAAVTLYKRLKFNVVGERKGYYQPAQRNGEEETLRPRALVMRLDLE